MSILTDLRQFRSTSYSAPPPAERTILPILPLPDSFLFHRMNQTGSTAILWPVLGRKTLGLRTQNEQMGIPVHSVAIRQTDGLSPFILKLSQIHFYVSE